MIGRVLRNGLVAGAAGTTALNAATGIPGEGGQEESRQEGLGALSGMLTGCGVGVVGAAMAPVLRRLPTTPHIAYGLVTAWTAVALSRRH